MDANRRMSDLIAAAELSRQSILQELKRLSSDLPLKYLRQQAHFTTPAADYKIAHKAATRGFSAVEKILSRYEITTTDLAERLSVETATVEGLLNSGHTRAPLVVVDSEDALVLDERSVSKGRENAVRVFREADWGATLRFYRPNGLDISYCVGDIVTVLIQSGQERSPRSYPIDGIVFPKVGHPREVEWVCQILSSVEAQLGLSQNQIKLQLLVESGRAVANLPEIAGRAAARLAGIILGVVDYSADLMLPTIQYDHPVADWARAALVNIAGAMGVPAIDSMTINYPVTDPTLSHAENRERILDRLKECYDDALHGMRMGMKGKWVGHPAQLFVTLLAYQKRYSFRAIQEEIQKIRSYLKSTEAKVGATIIEGVMSDRATDRHARMKLREAVTLGFLSPEEGIALGIVQPEEVKDLS